MEIHSLIKIDFYFTGDQFDIADITNKMGITPTGSRTRDSFPPSGLAHMEWSIQYTAENCNAVSVPFESLVCLLKDKKDTINSICTDYNVRSAFNVVIHMEEAYGPEIVLTKNILSFASAINAEICFDIYNDMK